MKNQFAHSNRSLLLSLLVILALGGCARGAMNVEGENTPVTATQMALCQSIEIQWPSPDTVVRSRQIKVRGTVIGSQGLASSFVVVDGTNTLVVDGQFEVELTRDLGAHTLEARCDGASTTLDYEVGFGAPSIEVVEPVSGAMIPSEQGTIRVVGTVNDAAGCERFDLNGQAVTIEPDGAFSVEYRPEDGMNHLDLSVECGGEVQTDLRRSFLYGRLADFDSQDTGRIAVQVNRSALDLATEALRVHLTPEELERMLDGYMGRNGDIEIHEFRYSDLEVEITPQQGRLHVRLRLHDFGVKVTYHYFAGRIRGWAKTDPAEVEATVVLRMTADGGYDLSLENPNVELHDFDLDLDDIYSVAEDIVEPYVRDMGRDALVDVLRGMVIENLLGAELLRQPYEFLGQQAELQLNLESLVVNPGGISAVANAEIAPLPAVKDIPAIWVAGDQNVPAPMHTDLSASLSVDVFNRMLAEATRGGLLDVDLAELLGEGGIGSSLVLGVLAGAAAPELLDQFSPTAAVNIKTDARMQPIISVVQNAAVGLKLDLGAIRLEFSSTDEQGAERTWAVFELSGHALLTPQLTADGFAFEVSFEPRVEVVEEPVVPLNTAAFEEFVQSILAGLSEGFINEQANAAFDFSTIDLFGIGIGQAHVTSDPAAPAFINFGLGLQLQ